MAKKDKKKNKSTPEIGVFRLGEEVVDTQNDEAAIVIGKAEYLREETQYNIQYQNLLKDDEQVIRWVSAKRLSDRHNFFHNDSF